MLCFGTIINHGEQATSFVVCIQNVKFFSLQTSETLRKYSIDSVSVLFDPHFLDFHL